MNTLVIVSNKNDYFFPYIKSSGIKFVNAYISNVSLFTKIIRRIPFLSIIVFDKLMKSYINESDNIIIFDNAYTWSLAFYIKIVRNKKNLILYFWNPVSKSLRILPSLFIHMAKLLLEIYSFDKKDCQKYNLSFYPIIYSKDVNLYHGIEHKYDVVFLGSAKDREHEIHSIYTSYLSDYNSRIIIVGENNNFKGFEYSNKRWSYGEYLDLICSSKAILDVVQFGQSGNTLRVVESIFLRKKLITTNKELINYDFYKKENIFIIGFESNLDFDTFMSTPYSEVSENIIQQYDFEYWVTQIIKRKEI